MGEGGGGGGKGGSVVPRNVNNRVGREINLPDRLSEEYFESSSDKLFPFTSSKQRDGSLKWLEARDGNSGSYFYFHNLLYSKTHQIIKLEFIIHDGTNIECLYVDNKIIITVY